MAYVAQQRLDGYAEMVAHAIKRKSAFDKRVLAHKPGEVTFSKGQLVQIYRSDLDYTFKTDRKLLPKWSSPQRVVERNLNSYTLEKLDGTPIAGLFSARRLREFTPREGTNLAREQAVIHLRNGEITGNPAQVRVDSANPTTPIIGDTPAEDENPGGGEISDTTSGDEDAATQEGGHME